MKKQITPKLRTEETSDKTDQDSQRSLGIKKNHSVKMMTLRSGDDANELKQIQSKE